MLSTVFDWAKTTPHDYLDDLQSFFYLLVYVMLLFRPDGSRVPGTEEGPSILRSWDEKNPRLAYANKDGLTGGDPVKYHIGRLIKASWGHVCEGLFMRFCAWTLLRRSDKDTLVFQKKGPEHLLPKRDEHYSAVLEMFDEALQAVKSSTKAKMRCSKLATDAVTPLPARRSARIRNLVMDEKAPSCTNHPRRSARIVKKRRLDDDKELEVQRPRAKRAKEAHRATRRSR